jgi:hypothetical protein
MASPQDLLGLKVKCRSCNATFQVQAVFENQKDAESDALKRSEGAEDIVDIAPLSPQRSSGTTGHRRRNGGRRRPRTGRVARGSVSRGGRTTRGRREPGRYGRSGYSDESIPGWWWILAFFIPLAGIVLGAVAIGSGRRGGLALLLCSLLLMPILQIVVLVLCCAPFLAL